jgi:hypothetical protein
MCLPCVLAVTVEVQIARGKVQYFLFGSSSCPLVGREEYWQLQLHCFCFPSSLFCHAGRVIATDNKPDRVKVVFVETRVPLNAYIRKLAEM